MVDEFEQIKSSMNDDFMRLRDDHQEQTNQRETFQSLISAQMNQLNAN